MSGETDDLTVPLADWDELKNRATIVLEENEILSNREKELKQQIVDMTTEYHWTTTNQSKEILLLMQDKVREMIFYLGRAICGVRLRDLGSDDSPLLSFPCIAKYTH